MAKPFSHVLLTRPRPESEELAALLRPLGPEPVILPAFDFAGIDIATEQPDVLLRMRQATAADLVVFTSPRAVEYGLPQMAGGALGRARVHAIGPSTARALAAAGVRAGVAPAGGYTSEALLDSLAAGPAAGAAAPRAFIVAAPGGREALAEGLGALGWKVDMLWVYRNEPATLSPDALGRLAAAGNVLSVWTSGNTMEALSRRLPTPAWFRVCQGHWVVISGRLERLARAYGPAGIHRAGGPDNAAIVAAVRALLA
jgi:uroporphyrinogen-III synthase